MEQKIESPCIRSCKLDKSKDVCISCNRTMEEIRNWRYYTDEKKLEILNKLKER
jgi:predicted Fe-S protein YdhL (DUF1289 family)